MRMQPTDQIIAPARITAEDALLAAARLRAPANGDEALHDYLVEVCRLAPPLGIDPAVAVAQSAHETGGWTSSWWRDRLNPAGIGITGDPSQNAASHTWETGTDAARAHLAHLLVYGLGPADAGSLWYRITGTSIGAVDSRYDAYVSAYGNAAMARTIADLAEKWAVDPEYAAGVCRWGNKLFATSSSGGGSTSVTTHSVLHNIAPINPANVPGWPLDLTRGPLYIVVHETGSPGSHAANEIALIQQPFQQQRRASFHLAVDPGGIVQGLPLDQVGFHAGDGCDDMALDKGCFRSIAIETCIGIDDPATRRVLAECIARVCAGDPAFDWGGGATRGRFDVDHLAQHNWVSDEGKDCPARIRAEGFWPTLMDWVDEAWAVYGHPNVPAPGPIPDPQWATKRKPPVWTGQDVVIGQTTWRAIDRVVTAIRETPRLQSATKVAKRVGPNIAAGEDFVINWVIKNRGGEYVVTPSGTTVRAADVTPHVRFEDAG